jgi:hypothetical protein
VYLLISHYCDIMIYIASQGMASTQPQACDRHDGDGLPAEQDCCRGQPRTIRSRVWDDARGNCLNLKGVIAIKLEAVPRYHESLLSVSQPP